jgi:hypothetical protein
VARRILGVQSVADGDGSSERQPVVDTGRGAQWQTFVVWFRLQVCYRTVPDSAAKVTVDSSLLSPGGSSTISLERLVISTASGDNATITLIGAVELSGEVTFQ